MKYSIGEFSTITSLTIKTLRLYHEKGILIPAYIDEFSKFRYYDNENYEKAHSIKILREHDFSLAEIKEILNDVNDESELIERLQIKLEQTKEKANQYKDISKSIENIIKQEREIKMNSKTDFEIEEKEVPTFLIAGYKMKGKYQEVGKGFKLLGKKFGRNINGKAMTIYYDDEYKNENANFEPCFPISKGNSTEDINVRELKGGNCISIIHKGPYDNLSSSYKKLFSYLKEKQFETTRPSREVYIKGPGMIFKGNPNNYLTEIQFFIDK